MEGKISTYHESFNFFKSISYKKNEYFAKGKFFGVKDKKISIRGINTFMMEGLAVVRESFENGTGRTVVKEEAIQRFHPNNIDNKGFWRECRKRFPLISVCGAESKNISHVNTQTLGMSECLGLLPFLKSLIDKSHEKLNVLEIGCGYGNLFFVIKDKCNYYGIDYIVHRLLKKHKNIIEIDKSGIPDQLLNKITFDVIYCVNVLQHCSQKDRFDYFQQS